MSTIKAVLVALVFIGVTAPSEAFAHQTYTLAPNSTWAFIGKVSGATWIGMSSNGGSSCHTWKKLSGTAGLDDDWNIVGTSTGEFVQIATGTFSHCNFTMSPPVTNGFTLGLYGNGGNDFLTGGAGMWELSGGDGDDNIEPFSQVHYQVTGGGGADFIYTHHASMDVYAGSGNDTACVYVTPLTGDLQGGSGVDRRCGSGQNMTGWDSTNCGSPC